MSYTIRMRAEVCDKCGREGERPYNCPDPTYNLTGIFDLALTGEGLPNSEVTEFAVVIFGQETDRPRGLRLLNNMKGKDSVFAIDQALARLADPTLLSKFVALEPENKWGTVPDAVHIFKRLKAIAEEYPDCVWEIH